MKLNISCRNTGAQMKFSIDDEKKLNSLYNKRIASEIHGETLGEEFKGFIFKITGGNDKQGFGMKQGVLTPSRVRLLLSPGDSCFRGYNRRSGERRRKSVRGCIVSADISVLNLVIVKKGDHPIAGLDEKRPPLRRDLKRASKIRKRYNLKARHEEVDFVHRYMSHKTSKENSSNNKKKMVKVQRVVTPLRIQRKKYRTAVKKARCEKSRTSAAEYRQLLLLRLKEKTKKA